MTLNDIYAENPALATKLQFDYENRQREAVNAAKREAETKEQEAARLKEESLSEIETFADSISAEMFGKSAKEITPEQEVQIAGTIQQVIDWMTKTKRGGGIIGDAYFLMNREGLLKKAKESGGMKVLKDLTERKGPASIDTGSGGEVKETGFEAAEKMTEIQLKEHIDRMSDKDADKFFKTAPQRLKDKYPSLPWD